MPEVDRTKMLRVLARGMPGWGLWCEVDTWPRYVVHFDGCKVYRGPDGPFEMWDPFTDGRSAFELLVAMRSRPLNIWNRFCDNLEVPIGSPMAHVLLGIVTPP